MKNNKLQPKLEPVFQLQFYVSIALKMFIFNATPSDVLSF